MTAGETRGRLLEVRDLETRVVTEDGVVQAVNGVTFHVEDGETLAVVGESGSGKTMTMLSIMRLVAEPPGQVTGQVLFDGADLLKLDGEAMRRIRGSRIGMIFQDPLTSLDPVFAIGDQIDEAMRPHLDLGKRALRTRTLELLSMVNIANPDRIADAYPHQLSGGMSQRVMLAIAIACQPRLLIADEPTTALDITTQAQLLELVRGLQSELGMAIIWITHDLGIVAGLADRVQVMYGGRIVESADVETLYADPLHPYTLGLLSCVPRLDRDRSDRLTSIPGAPPSMIGLPPGCTFAPRCSFRLERCTTDMPGLEVGDGGHQRACWAETRALRAAAG
jgi:oligopeptide transport system ATP-binding protein